MKYFPGFKKATLIVSVLVLVIAALFTFTSSKPAKTDEAKIAQSLQEMNARFDAISTQPYFMFPSAGATFDYDTITSTESDTLYIDNVSNLLSNWYWNWTVNATQLSGTTNVIGVVQESSYAGTDETLAFDWVEVDRDTLSSGETVRLLGDPSVGTDHVRGTKQRLILTGVGTQSTRYRYKFIAKKD